jgi:hypothetical protein
MTLFKRIGECGLVIPVAEPQLPPEKSPGRVRYRLELFCEACDATEVVEGEAELPPLFPLARLPRALELSVPFPEDWEIGDVCSLRRRVLHCGNHEVYT